jgi:hypothetical protein
MRKGRAVAFMVGLAVLITVLVLGSLGTVKAECELCVEYHGQTVCRRGSGADRDEAIQAAKKAACALLATGMAESVNCQNAPTTNTLCTQ